MLDITRSAITVQLGNKDVASSATFDAGSIASLNASGQLVVADGTAAYGVFKWNKQSANLGVVINEEVVLTGTTTVNLKHANISNVKLTATVGGAALAENTDWEVKSATNGQIARKANIVSGATFYCSYTYELTTAEKQYKGTNYMNSTDDTAGNGKMTVITGYAEIYTDQFDTSDVYAVGDALYVGQTTTDGIPGLFTKKNTSGKAYGLVIAVPTADDPFLGVQIK